jgi:hypothetical protein
LRSRRDFTYTHHAAGIAVPAIFDDGDVEIDDVALFETLIARDAVAHDMIDRGADRLGKAAVIEGSRHRLLYVYDVVVAARIEFVGGDTGHHVRCDHVDHLSREAARDTHLFLLGRGFD